MGTRKLRCFCGETVIKTSMLGDSPDCVGCTECHSTLATVKEKCKQRKSHTFDIVGKEKTCIVCFHMEYDGQIIVKP